MKPFDAFSIYQSMKLHFTSDSYDAAKYNFKTSVKPATFLRRKDKYFFEKIARRFPKQEELIQFYACHFIAGNTWIGNMLDDETSWTEWNKRSQSFTYLLKSDISKLTDYEFDDLFVINNSMPRIVEIFLAGDIMFETVVIIDALTSFTSKVKCSDTIIWPDLKLLIDKSSPFISVDMGKIQTILIESFTR